MCSYIISVVYICSIISFLKGFNLFYHIPHTFVMHNVDENSLKIKKTRKMMHAYNKDKTRLIILKR